MISPGHELRQGWQRRLAAGRKDKNYATAAIRVPPDLTDGSPGTRQFVELPLEPGVGDTHVQFGVSALIQYSWELIKPLEVEAHVQTPVGHIPMAVG